MKEYVAIFTTLLTVIGGIITAIINKNELKTNHLLWLILSIVFLGLIVLFHVYRRKSKKINLFNHHLFRSIDYYLNVGVNQISIKNPLKKQMMVEFLKIHFDQFKKDFIEALKTKKTPCDYMGIIYSALNSIEVTAKAKGIPEIFIVKFNEFNKNNTESMIKWARSYVDSTIAIDETLKIYFIFNSVLQIFDMMILDCQQSLNELNGELEAQLKKRK